MGDRSDYIDVLRGWAILLVLLGHAGQRNITYIPQNMLTKSVFSFGYWHMAVFIAVSGYLAFGRVPQDAWGWLVRKGRMLLVPYFAWTLVYYWIPDPFISKAGGLAGYVKIALVNPGNTFWYFYVLFMCYAVLALISKLGDVWIVPLGVVIVLVPLQEFGMDLLKWYWWWFALGYVAARYSGVLLKLKWPAWILAGAAYPVLLVFVTDPSALQWRIAWGLTGVVASTGIASLIVGTRARGLFAHLGRHSFVLYPSEFVFFALPLPATVLRIPAYVLIAVVGGLGLERVLERVPFLRALFLGGRTLVPAPPMTGD